MERSKAHSVDSDCESMEEGEVIDDCKSFSWTDLDVLMVGDERVLSLSWKTLEGFPNQDIFYVTGGNTKSICSLVDQKITEHHNIVIICGFHYDLCFYEYHNGKEMKLHNNPNFPVVIDVVKEYASKWKWKYPNKYFVFAMPYPVDFYVHNQHLKSSEGLFEDKEQLLLTNLYFCHVENLFNAINKAAINQCYIFNVNKFPFFKRTVYHFADYLDNGLFPQKNISKVFAYYFIEFLHKRVFPLQNKLNIDLNLAKMGLGSLEDIYVAGMEGQLNLPPSIISTDISLSSDINQLYSSKTSDYLAAVTAESLSLSSTSSLSPSTSISSKASSQRPETPKFVNFDLIKSLISGKDINSDGSYVQSRQKSDSPQNKSKRRSTSRPRSPAYKPSSRLKSSECKTTMIQNLSSDYQSKSKTTTRHRSSSSAKRSSSHRSVSSSTKSKSCHKPTPLSSEKKSETKRRLSPTHNSRKNDRNDSSNRSGQKEKHSAQSSKRKHMSSRSDHKSESHKRNKVQSPLKPKPITEKYSYKLPESQESKSKEQQNQKERTVDAPNEIRSNTSTQYASTEKDEEIQFWRALKRLKDVHDVECEVFRKNPISHPLYAREKIKFFDDYYIAKTVKSKPWDEFWMMRMEELFQEKWNSSKIQLSLECSKIVNNKTDNFKKSSHVSSEDTKICLHATNNKVLDIKTEECDNMTTLSDSLDIPYTKDYTTLNGAIEPMISSNDQLYNDAIGEEVDFDLIMNDPMFKQGIDDIDMAIKTVFKDSSSECSIPVNVDKCRKEMGQTRILFPCVSKIEDVKSEFEIGNTADAMNPMGGSSSGLLYNSHNDSINLEFLNILKMLSRISQQLGPIGLSISKIYSIAKSNYDISNNALAALDSDAKMILQLAGKKITNLLANHMTIVQKAIYGEIVERTTTFLNCLRFRSTKFPKLDIKSIAVTIKERDVASAVEFIKDTLQYHGYVDFSGNDLMDIYRAVQTL